MKTRLLIGGQYAYAIIETATRKMDVRLEPGRSAAQSLRETAADMRAKAEALIARADVIAQAAEMI